MKSNSALIIVNEYRKKTELTAPIGKLLSVVLAQNGFETDSPCGGNGRCGKCRVRFLQGAPAPSSYDERFLSGKELEDGYRLLCKAVIKNNCEIEIVKPEKDMVVEGADISSGDTSFDKKGVGRTFAIAVDLGSTTIAAALVAKSGNELVVLRSASTVNHQRRFGTDVISRISAAEDPEVLKELSDIAIADIKGLADELLLPEKDNGKLAGALEHIAIAGNTTMMNLLLGRDVSWLGRFPYTPAGDELELQTVPAKELFGDYEGTLLTLVPGISAFVGADIVSGMYYLKSEGIDLKNTMFVDLGTNGEMAYFDHGAATVTSTAAGPVFEAGGISCGVASVPGAICHVELKDNDGKISAAYETIGDAEPIGLCGTGVLELVSEAVRVGLIDETGLLSEPYFETGFPLTQDDKIILSQQDVRNLQLGKAAIRTGAATLLGGNVPDNVYLAGGFGTHIHMDNVKNLRMFPEEFDGKIIPVGNTSLKGAISFVRNALMGPCALEGAAKELKEIAQNASVINLATLDEFDEKYIDAMNF
ncbi:MAG: DUF4445 domain-containing protein [Butyrivibrio sp.]|nr:DUF4445 domain-containing protein [Butyrivibrio sp.]